jgi:two-component system, sporulation sensor kinase E
VQIHRVIHQMGQRSRVSGLESQIVSRWGTHVPVTVAITRLPSSDKITRYLFNIMDITPQKVIEAEKLMITELVGIMGTGVGPAEALPKLIERLSTKVPIEYGLVARLNNEGEMLDVVAVYSALEKSSIQIGQELKSEYLPAEEELWMREGIVRNNLQPYGLHPLETLLFQEGVRSYLSLPLIDRGRLIGGAHFGSSKAYALNRGHLSLFREIASALTGALVRDLQGDVTSRYRRFNSVLAERLSDPALLCDSDGRIFQVNEAARRFLGEGSELSGRLAKVVLGTQFPGVAGKGELLTRASEEPLPLTDARGIEWTLSVHRVGEQRAPQGYLLILAKA